MKCYSELLTWVWWTFFIGGFVAIKLAGVSLAAWSWWWLLFPAVPLLGILIQRYGL